MSKNNASNSRIVRKKRRFRKRVYFILIPILIAFISVVGYAINLYLTTERVLTESHVEDEREKSELRDEVVDPKFDNVSILIMGIDESEKRDNADNARTDALMLATLNKDEKSVKLLSIPRDSYVYIPEIGRETRINHAHAHGGPQATIETVENLLDIPVDYFVRVNFESFIDVVEALDGITVDVPYEFSEQDSKDRPNQIHLLPGKQTLNGEEALALARTRKLDNDIERGKRQQEILKAIVDKTISLNSILKFDDIIEAVGKNMSTSMSPTDIKSFISYGTSGRNLSIETLTLEGRDYQPSNMYFWLLDDVALEETKDTLKAHLEIEPRTLTESSNIESENALESTSY